VAQMQIELHPDVRKFGPEVQGILQQLSPSQIAYFNSFYSRRRKDALSTFVLSIFGVDRFYLNQYFYALLKLLAIGSWALAAATNGRGLLLPALGFVGFIWWLVDLASFSSRTRIVNESIALATAREVKELVDPNAVPPASETDALSPILILLIVVAIAVISLAIALILR